MSLVNSLEQKLGHLAIPHLIRMLAVFQVAVWALIQMRPDFAQFIALDRERVLSGEVWRLITWVFDFGRIYWLWVIFAVLLQFMMGDGLEEAWGSFKVNLYIIGGILAVDIGTMCFDAAPAGILLNSTILLAFAMFFPDFEIYVYFILPIKVKYLAWLTGAFLLFEFVASDVMRVPILFSTLNFLVAFVPHFVRKMRNQGAVLQRRARFDSAQRPDAPYFHKCASCGKTDVEDPKLDFRVTADGEEYCNVCRPVKQVSQES